MNKLITAEKNANIKAASGVPSICTTFQVLLHICCYAVVHGSFLCLHASQTVWLLSSGLIKLNVFLLII